MSFNFPLGQTIYPVCPILGGADLISGYAFKSEWFGTGNDKVIRIGDLQEGSIQTESALTVDAAQYKISDNFKIQENITMQ